jgi:hypothetical protein
MSDQDTHRGELRQGTVATVCGVEFIPLWPLRRDSPGLPSEPSDPAQICPACQLVGDEKGLSGRRHSGCSPGGDEVQ